jgi:hypothetical protein
MRVTLVGEKRGFWWVKLKEIVHMNCLGVAGRMYESKTH